MNEKRVPFKELNEDQRRVRGDAVQIHEDWLAAREEGRHLAGGMCWKKSKGNEYLFRLQDRYGNGKSMGRRSAETEKMFLEYRREKQQVAQRLSALQSRLRQHARFCKAAGVHRVPAPVSGVLRLLENEGLLGQPAVVVGTNALYAYEAVAGVCMDPSVVATQDLAVSWDCPSERTARFGSRANKAAWLAFFRKADKSFRVVKGADFLIMNDDGYAIHVLNPISGPLSGEKPAAAASPRPPADPENADFRGLMSAPRLRATVVCADGFSVTMTVPEPRSFLEHKTWLSRREGRDTLKRQRDLAQISALAELLDRPAAKARPEPSATPSSPKQDGLQATVEMGRDFLDRLNRGGDWDGIKEEDRNDFLAFLFELNKSIVSVLRKQPIRKP